MLGGASACFWSDELGSLEVGKKADLIVLDVGGAEWLPNPLSDPIPNLVYSSQGSSVETVIVDGRIVMSDRQILTIDEKAVLREADRASRAVLERIGYHQRRPWPLRT